MLLRSARRTCEGGLRVRRDEHGRFWQLGQDTSTLCCNSSSCRTAAQRNKNTTVNSNPQGFWNLQQPTPVATLQLPERFLDTNVTAVNIQKQGQTTSTSAYHHTMRAISGVYTMDVKYPLLVVGCAERHVPLGCTSRISRKWKGSWVKRRLLRLVYNLQAIQQNPAPYKQGQTALKMQTRAICSPAALSPHAHA